jgi:DNA repair protein RadC
MNFRGIGKAKAIGITAAFELGRRASVTKQDKRKAISSSREVFDLMHPVLGGLDHEEFWILLLNNANLLECKWQLSIGGITATLVDVRLMYKKAIEHGATSIILCHNHPSGNLRPSNADKMLTKKVVKGGSLLDIKVLDHLIVTENSYYSFADEGNL